MTVTEKRRRKEKVMDGLDRIDELLSRIDEAADRLLAQPPTENPDAP